MEPASDVLTVVEVAHRLGLSAASVYRAIERGDLPTLHFGRRCVGPRPAFEEMMRTGRQPQREAGHESRSAS